MKNKVVHLVYSFGCGGLEKVIVNLINNSSNIDLEHIVISLTNELTMQEQLEFPVKIISLDKSSGNDFKSHWKLFSLLKKIKPITIQTYNFSTLEYHFVAKLAGVQNLIHSDHGRGGDHPEGKNKLHNIFRNIVGKIVDYYVVVSYDLKNWVVESISVSENKVHLVFNGVKVNKIVRCHNSKPINFVSIGRLDPIKNQKLLIESFAEAISEGVLDKESKLQLVGDGPSRIELELLIEKLQVADSIKLLGYRSDIESILRSSDAFLLSSLYEAMPMTILEAMANKIPVLCTDVGGISKFISHDHALIVPSVDKHAFKEGLKTLQKNNKEQKDKINSAYKLVCENYSVETMVDVYTSMYLNGVNR